MMRTPPPDKQGWGQLHNINSNSNSRGFNSNSNSGQSPEYQLQLQLRGFQLQLQFQLRQISRISTPTPTPTPEVSTPTPTLEISTPIPTPTLEFQIQPQLHFKSNQTCSTKLPLPNYNVKHCELNEGTCMLSIYAMLSQILIKQVNIGIADDKIFPWFLNTLLSEQNGPHFADNIFKYLFWIKMFVFSIN